MKTEVFRHNEEKWSHTFRIPRGWGILSFGILGVSLESQSARNHGDGCEEEHGAVSCDLFLFRVEVCL